VIAAVSMELLRARSRSKVQKHLVFYYRFSLLLWVIPKVRQLVAQRFSTDKRAEQ
jgi:hypothetical protein